MPPVDVSRGRRSWRTKQSEHVVKYAYLDLDDSFMFDEENALLLVEIEYLDSGWQSVESRQSEIGRRAAMAVS